MRKGLLAICSVLLISLAVLVPSCTPTAKTGTIQVKATLCGNPWTGNVSYTLTPASGSPVSGTNVTASFNVTTGNWTCGSVSGGPAGAFLNSIPPSATQFLDTDGTITFTLDFELNQDAWITLGQPHPWTLNGSMIEYIEYAVPCNVLDAHYMQGVHGCNGYNVTLNETSWLMIAQIAGPPATIYVVNATCAVNKTPPEIANKVFQVPSINNAPAQVGQNITLILGQNTTLDVETQWQLVQNVTYMKNINWFGIQVIAYEPGVHNCTLFELILPAPPVGQYTFILKTSAQVALVGATDGNATNDNSGWSPQLTLIM